MTNSQQKVALAAAVLLRNAESLAERRRAMGFVNAVENFMALQQADTFDRSVFRNLVKYHEER